MLKWFSVSLCSLAVVAGSTVGISAGCRLVSSSNDAGVVYGLALCGIIAVSDVFFFATLFKEVIRALESK